MFILDYVKPGTSYFNPHHTRGVPVCCRRYALYAQKGITDDIPTLLQLLWLRLDLDHGDYHAETSTKDGRSY